MLFQAVLRNPLNFDIIKITKLFETIFYINKGHQVHFMGSLQQAYNISKMADHCRFKNQ